MHEEDRRASVPPSGPEEGELVERLVGHSLLGDAPREELAWLAARGELRRMEAGEVLSAPDKGPVRELYIILSGRVCMYTQRGGVPRRVIEWTGGDVAGLLPYSRLGKPPGIARIEEWTDLLVLPGEDLPDLARECHGVTTKLVGTMLDRTRHFQKDDLHQARMASLGRLAAGLAHELDNPASAVVRGAKLLVPLLEEADRAARALGESGIPAEQYAAAEALRDRCAGARVHLVRSPLEQARHEEAIARWLEGRDVPIADVEALAETPLTVEMLDGLARTLSAAFLGPALAWVAAASAVRGVASELGEAATRIFDLVGAVRGFTQMDAAAAPQPVDVAAGLSQTLAVLRSKARERSIAVSIRSEPDLPPAHAVAGELNQVWANLIDNAFDAVADGGTVEISARREGTTVVVRVVDDGPGIPSDIREKVFEPFFTTKPVGKGAGLGLDIVRRLVHRNGGEVELHSVPGRTELRVRLPAWEGPAPGTDGGDGGEGSRGEAAGDARGGPRDGDA